VTPTGSPDGVRRARLLVAYHGASFRGFAPQPGVPTVLGTLADAVERIVRVPVELTGAGRTDAGVHAWGQVVSGDLPAGTDLEALVRRSNKMCGPAIVVRAARWTAPGFDARFSALWRQYRYDVWNDPVPNPFYAATSWHVPQPLRLWVMQQACAPLIGEHDFSSFCRRPKHAEADAPAGEAPFGGPPVSGPPVSGPPVSSPVSSRPVSMVRRVLRASWDEVDDTPGMLRFEIRANAFCHQMVRSIVGLLVDVGLGRRSAGDLTAVLRARDRAAAGPVAPPQGLTLWEVGYPAELDG
jgi:tRNA pseudouridine38-40 synthase